MTIPGASASPLSNEEIVRFIDVAAADVFPGWVPSEHYHEDSLVLAWNDAQQGNDQLYKLMTQNRVMAVMIIEGKKLLDHYDIEDSHFVDLVEKTLGKEFNEPLATFMLMRSDILAQRVIEWDKPETQLAMFQLDSFLLGWLVAKAVG